LGECVLGNEVANELGLAVGDHLLSSPENFLDLAGVYPLKMKVVGILDPSQGPDDRAIFTDLKTNWVIMGLGHGHQDLEKINDPTMILNKDTLGVTASAKVYMYNEINPENIQDFHFHGNMEEYPISSAIFVPNDLKSGTILRGRFESGAFKEQMIVPTEVVENLLQTIFRIKRIFNMVFVLVGLATMVIIALIVVLTLRLRKDELFTMFTIGSNRFKVAQIVISELFVILMLSVSLSLFLYEITGFYVEEFIRQFII
jgi:putative ABC transport system permease protein